VLSIISVKNIKGVRLKIVEYNEHSCKAFENNIRLFVFDIASLDFCFLYLIFPGSVVFINIIYFPDCGYGRTDFATPSAKEEHIY
jgi:hypothetical protein